MMPQGWSVVESSTRPLRILIMAAEVEPFVKASEIDGVISSLARALRTRGHDVRIAMPRHRSITTERFALEQLMPPFSVPMDGHGEMATIYRATVPPDVPVYIVDNPRYLRPGNSAMYLDDAERFIFFTRATLEMLKRPELNWQPDVIHCHDWQTAIVPNWLVTVYKDDPFYAHTATVFTIHRLSNQGIFGFRVLQIAGLEKYGFIPHPDLVDLSDLVDLLARGIYYADMVTTDSERYAQEICTPEYGERLDPLLREKGDRLRGILHGLDPALFNPEVDPALVAHYSSASIEGRQPNKSALQRAFGLVESPTTPLVGMISPLDDDKGFDLLAPLLQPMMANLDLQLVVHGSGEAKYEDLLGGAVKRFPGRVGWRAENGESLERRIYAGCDMILLPSLTEPCSLCPMVAMHYGSVLIARCTGVLADLVRNYDPRTREGNGFSFGAHDTMALYTAIVRAVEVFHHRELWAVLQQRCMGADFSWDGPMARYEEVYRRAVEAHGQAASGVR